ncbi:unnamed protein product, partial [Ectocarpus sp. 12 AP-2014]
PLPPPLSLPLSASMSASIRSNSASDILLWSSPDFMLASAGMTASSSPSSPAPAPTPNDSLPPPMDALRLPRLLLSGDIEAGETTSSTGGTDGRLERRRCFFGERYSA